MDNMSAKFTFSQGEQTQFLDSLYKQYQSDKNSVDLSWQKFFEGMDYAVGQGLADSATSSDTGHDSALVEAYINAYRKLGHLGAYLNPLNTQPSLPNALSAELHGLKDIDRSKKFYPVNLAKHDAGFTFDEIDKLLKETYCGSIGAEFRDSDSIEFVTWIQDKMESCRNKPVYSAEKKLGILHELIKAEGFESFLQARYLGQKRFSVEGVDTLIPFLQGLTESVAKLDVEEICLGMAHRGRLNVLTNYMGKTYELMLKEFEGLDFNPMAIDGDVKYHMGYVNEKKFQDKNIRLFLCPNPSHLEAVNPVVEGFVRARQRLIKDKNRKLILPILIHGDAAATGQGIVAETYNLSELPGYTTGGTIHIIVNNQVGFTTNPEEGRSCRYASGLAKFINAPVLHVNGDDPEAVVWCAEIAGEYRQRFQKDIVVEITGYRRYGHNETDEPSFTQPIMYKKIAAHLTVMNLYGQKLIAEKILTADAFQEKITKFRARMQEAHDLVKGKDFDKEKFKSKIPKSYNGIFDYIENSEKDFETSPKTGLAIKKLCELGRKIAQVPQGFTPHPKIVRLLESRNQMLEGEGSCDWAFAELLAFGTLAEEGHDVRLSGQDCLRGTFSSRHAVISDFETGKRLELLNQLFAQNLEHQPRVEILNSPLSEQGVMGFDFGYNVADPNALVCWEAQFGDFSNGAQIIIDQFLVASEAKWKQTSGLVLLLPHGYEGMGPEHSSARLERFLQLCGNFNMQVAIPTTAAQYFHILRRQLYRPFRKPLVIMSPKSLLRSDRVLSKLIDFEGQKFKEVLADDKPTKNCRKVLFCTGKIYYEIVEMMEKNNITDVSVNRVEQLYPFPKTQIKKVLENYENIHSVVWIQEEPQNMGAWTFVQPRLIDIMSSKQRLQYVGRRDSGTTAEGANKAHVMEQNRIITEALK